MRKAKDIVMIIGVIMLLFCGACVESESIVPSLVMGAMGILLIGWALITGRRFND